MLGNKAALSADLCGLQREYAKERLCYRRGRGGSGRACRRNFEKKGTYVQAHVILRGVGAKHGVVIAERTDVLALVVAQHQTLVHRGHAHHHLKLALW